MNLSSRSLVQHVVPASTHKWPQHSMSWGQTAVYPLWVHSLTTFRDMSSFSCFLCSEVCLFFLLAGLEASFWILPASCVNTTCSGQIVCMATGYLYPLCSQQTPFSAAQALPQQLLPVPHAKLFPDAYSLKQQAPPSPTQISPQQVELMSQEKATPCVLVQVL